MKPLLLLLSLTCSYDAVQAQKTYEVTWVSYGKGMLAKQTKGLAYWQVYNADNLLVEQRYPAQEGVERKIVYRYNDKKKLVAQEEQPQDAWMPVRSSTYDSSGSLVAASWKRRNKEDDTIAHHEIYQYDQEGRLAYKEQKSSRNGKLLTTEGWKYSYTPEGEGIKTTEIYFIDGKKKNRVKYEIYNDKGLLVYTRDGYHITQYTYEYDAAGDWIVQKRCVKDGDIGIWRCEGEFRRAVKL